MITLSHEGLFMFATIWFGLGFGLGGLWMLVRVRNAQDDKRRAAKWAGRG